MIFFDLFLWITNILNGTYEGESFPEFFQLIFFQIHQMNPLSIAVIDLQKYFLNNKTWKSKLLLDMGYRIDVMLAEWKQHGPCTSPSELSGAQGHS